MSDLSITNIRAGQDGIEEYSVLGPDLMREKLVPLHGQGQVMLGARMGRRPSRASLHRWRTDGYPVVRDGPRVILPTATQLKNVYVSTESCIRWLRVVAQLSEEIQSAGGVVRWRERNRRRHYAQSE